MITKYSDYAAPCHMCNIVNTTGRDEKDNPICAACSNDIYYEKKKSGEIIELIIDMTKVRPSTLTAIRAMIEKDIEEHTPNP